MWTSEYIQNENRVEKHVLILMKTKVGRISQG